MRFPCRRAFSFGIEEEYFLVDAETKFVTRAMPDGFLKKAKDALDGQVTGEFLQSQIEVITPPLTDIGEARTNCAICAKPWPRSPANTAWRFSPPARIRPRYGSARSNRKGKRYDDVMDDLQMIGRRNMLCGLHVHVELPDPDDRVDVMTRMLPYLPLFIALSTSSPFWRSQLTGLKGYRLAAYDELPRTGVPELFHTKTDFDAYIKALVRAGVMPDASYIWWAIRPSLKHPTLEMRAPDCCTRIEDSIAIAALYRVLAYRLYRNPRENYDMDAVARAIIVENKWRAQRYGVSGSFVKIEGNGAVSVADIVDELIAAVARRCQSAGLLGRSRALPRDREGRHLGRSAAHDLRAASRQSGAGLTCGDRLGHQGDAAIAN